MSLKTKIDEDLKEALLARDAARVTVLRGLKATILDAEVAQAKRETGLEDDEIAKLVLKEIKKRQEAIEVYSVNGREELVEAEESEAKVLECYAPKQMSEDEIKTKIDEVLINIPGVTMKDMGRVIGEVKGLVGNAADGAVIAKLVKERLS
jgi:hypothetical protein